MRRSNPAFLTLDCFANAHNDGKAEVAADRFNHSTYLSTSCPALRWASTSCFRFATKTWMAGSSPAMTTEETVLHPRQRLQALEGQALGILDARKIKPADK